MTVGIYQCWGLNVRVLRVLRGWDNGVLVVIFKEGLGARSQK
jgi:hypothetical protein